MTTITVKNIPDELYARLKVHAEANRRSINSEIIVCIERAVMSRAKPVDELVRQARELRNLTQEHPINDERLANAIETGRP